MLRRSPRLKSTGYYNSDGEPMVSHQETRVRPSRRCRKRRPDNTKITKTTKISSENSCSSNEDPMKYTLRHFCLQIIFLSLFFGYTCLVSHLHSETPISSPTTINTVPVPGCEDKETNLKELQEELLRLKKNVDYLLPSVDLWPNFALKSQGAMVLHKMSSDTYQDQEVLCTWFGFSIRRPAVTPDIVIQGKSCMLPGQCWPFAGSQGHLSIGLSHNVTISHVTLGHLPKILSPTGTICSAPKEFAVFGKRNLQDEGTLLGSFLFDEDGNQLQTFKLPDHRRATFSFIKLLVNSNWGHPEYTCLYNFRVHGKVEE